MITFFLTSLLVFPYLLAWNGQNLATEQLQVADDTNSGAARFYARTDHGLNWGAAMAAHGEGTGQAVGLFAYGETDGEAIAWGANLMGASYSGAPAVGVEINGLNRSGDPHAKVYGATIVNGGNATTWVGLAIETSLLEPQGKPRIGIALQGTSTQNPSAPASEVGIAIDHIDSGVALKIAQGDKILLSHDGRAYLYFDGSRIRLVKDGIVRGSW